MFAESPDNLLALAELAIALAGFSAIIVVLRNNDSEKWAARDVDYFHGMITHSAFATLFCLLPALVNLVAQDTVLTLRVCCALIGLQIISQAVVVLRLPSSGKLAVGTMLLGLLLGFSQLLVFTPWGEGLELRFYQGPIIWHILQAGMLFVLLVWIPDSERDDIDNSGG